MEVSINKKTGFITTSKRVVIFRYGIPFYCKTRKNKTLSFNLPAGNYLINEGDVKKLSNPIRFNKIKLTPPNKVSNFSGKINVSWIDNPNRCSVDLSSGDADVYFDNEYRDYPWFVIIFIIGHELGHFLYRGRGQESEKCCDNYSANMMLDLGYNPSQIDAAIEMAISNKSKANARKKLVYENLLKVN